MAKRIPRVLRPTRRSFLTQSGVVGLSALLAEGVSACADAPMAEPYPAQPLKVVCAGAHPDDPESGVGGTLARYSAAGHQVTVIYLTRGEAGIEGKSHDEAATIRTAEAEAACKILEAKAVFAGQIDGATEVNSERAQALRQLLEAEEPDVVFTHWPLDTHTDHQAASLLTLRAYLGAPERFVLYFFEVNSGTQTLGFVPAAYVDVTPTRDQKKMALFAHKSQNWERIYSKHHEPMETFRGRELGVAAAEAFAQLARDNRAGGLPGL